MTLSDKFIELVKIGIIAKQIQNPHRDIAISVLDDAYNIVEKYDMMVLIKKYDELWGLAQSYVKYQYGEGRRPEWYG